MRKKRLFFIISIAIVAIIVVWQFVFQKNISDDVLIKPSYGDFKISVTTTGELKAKHSIEIKAPSNSRSVGIYRMRISKLIPEGTIVDSGAFVAELDKSEILGKIKEKQLSVDQLQSKLLTAKLDSSLSLSGARDNLENLKYDMEEKKLLQEQSKYEPPATLRQAKISYERIKRNYQQAVKNYKTQVRKAIADISVVNADLQKQQQKLNKLIATMDGFTIYAPAHGMVIYQREWNGSQRTVGSEISPWDPSVATLPDLTKMESITFVNEIDIQKIKKGQKVIIKLDANQNKNLTGKVIRVANIGEQRRNSDSKVFEVRIDVDGKDTTLLPSMTTSNEIIVNTLKNVLFVPLECIHTEIIKKKKTTFVYKKNDGHFVRQQVKLGKMNENDVVILKGLSKEDEIALSIPENAKKLKFIALKEENKSKTGSKN